MYLDKDELCLASTFSIWPNDSVHTLDKPRLFTLNCIWTNIICFISQNHFLTAFKSGLINNQVLRGPIRSWKPAFIRTLLAADRQIEQAEWVGVRVRVEVRECVGRWLQDEGPTVRASLFLLLFWLEMYSWHQPLMLLRPFINTASQGLDCTAVHWLTAH